MPFPNKLEIQSVLGSLGQRKRTLLLLVIVSLIVSLVIFGGLSWVKNGNSVQNGDTPATDTPEQQQLRDDCFREVSQITEKEAEQYSQFRSLADYRLYRLRLCLDKSEM